MVISSLYGRCGQVLVGFILAGYHSQFHAMIRESIVEKPTFLVLPRRFEKTPSGRCAL